MRQPFSQGQPGCRSVARSHDSDHWLQQNIAFALYSNQRRWRIDGAQGKGIIGLTQRDETRARPPRHLHLAKAHVTFGNTDLSPARCFSQQRRQGRKRRPCPTIAIDQRAKRTRANIVAADQTQLFQPLFICEPDAGRILERQFALAAHVLPPILPSVPSIKREIFGQCLSQSSTASAASSSATLVRAIAQSAMGTAALAPSAAADE